ncbi:hypothetical protein B484DRAFT_454353 [Ochromonadaceae sp. CCMP2298]|nr:hypothetical protein B484DRAFT_454353 [Ochromonadaceae sp. CCMP2298]|mmetsp:Transcript_20304/g.45154  ORF Transcript_20304/g.45154 Transcript_20304/m.45154 type:complete len:263 (+) Transcript_20304:388-1176(+)
MTDAAGRSKGCGLVEFATVEGAQRAILELNDTELQGRPVFVREDRETGAPSAPVVKPMTTLRDPAGLPVVVAKLGLSRHVYVGNLSWDVQWQDLKDHMKTVGEVLHADVLLEATGRSKGCGIVEYANVEGANAAILGLQNSTLKNRPIFVREDRERITKAGGGSGVAAPGDGGAVISGGRLYIGNLDFKVRWFDLKDHFKTIGPVIRADVSMEDDGVRSKGYGIVEYASGQDAAKAIEQLNDSLLNGRPINVREDREEKRRY